MRVHRSTQRAVGEQPAQARPAARALHEQGQARAVLEHRLGARDRLDARRLRGLVEARDAVHAAAVGHRHGGQPERRCPLRQRLRLARPLQERERRVRVQLAIPGTGLRDQ